MEAMNQLMSHVRERPSELKRLQQAGAKIIGYVPNEYLPEELVSACGAIPVGLNRGGSIDAVTASQTCIFRLIDTFCRAQIGYRILGEPLYQLPDLMVVPITDRNILAIADIWQLHSGVEVFKYGVPRYTGVDYAFEYFVDGLKLLVKRLEEITGAKMDIERLKADIQMTNRINSLLQKISYTRLSDGPPISGKDFIKINHATYSADRKFLVSALESVYAELTGIKASKNKGPRIMLVGSTLAEGDSTLVDLLEGAGASIVIEEFSEGLRHYQPQITTGGDPIQALAERYLEKRLPPALFHSVMRERFDYFLKLAREFRVDGIIWYSLLYRDCYDREGLLFSRFMEKEAGLPVLKIVSDYNDAETGQMMTRVETFIDIIKHGGKR